MQFKVRVKVKGKWRDYGYASGNDGFIARAIEEEVFNCEDIQFIEQ